MKTNHQDLDKFEKHQADVAAAYNNATPKEREEMQKGLAHLKALRVSSVGGLRGLFPTLTGRLQVTKEVLKNEQ